MLQKVFFDIVTHTNMIVFFTGLRGAMSVAKTIEAAFVIIPRKRNPITGEITGFKGYCSF